MSFIFPKRLGIGRRDYLGRRMNRDGPNRMPSPPRRSATEGRDETVGKDEGGRDELARVRRGDGESTMRSAAAGCDCNKPTNSIWSMRTKADSSCLLRAVL